MMAAVTPPVTARYLRITASARRQRQARNALAKSASPCTATGARAGPLGRRLAAGTVPGGGVWCDSQSFFMFYWGVRRRVRHFSNPYSNPEYLEELWSDKDNMYRHVLVAKEAQEKVQRPW